jgi:CRISPR-associated exonuclease Cas4
MYSDDELLMLSGIQHIAFCERQWALIYIEQLWEENLLTIQGHHLHQRVDDPFESNQKNGIYYLRGVYIVSYELGLYGKADLIEVTVKDKNTPWKGLANFKGNDSVIIKPVEYKRGKPKVEPVDEVQLCAQAICLEEMYNLIIKEGAIFYGEPRRRFDVIFDDNLRTLTRNYALRMHELYNLRKTPMPIYKKHCHSCSIFHLCNPKISLNPSATEYLNSMLNFEK